MSDASTPPRPSSPETTGEYVEDSDIVDIYSRVMGTFPKPERFGLMPDALDGDNENLRILYDTAQTAARNMTIMLTARLKAIRNIDEHVRHNNPSRKGPYFEAVARWLRELDTCSRRIMEDLDPSDTAVSNVLPPSKTP